LWVWQSLACRMQPLAAVGEGRGVQGIHSNVEMAFNVSKKTADGPARFPAARDGPLCSVTFVSIPCFPYFVPPTSYSSNFGFLTAPAAVEVDASISKLSRHVHPVHPPRLKWNPMCCPAREDPASGAVTCWCRHSLGADLRPGPQACGFFG
jgi:hypothetical protein